MLRVLLTLLLPLLAAALLSGCCGSVPCDCQDYQDDALFFRFDADSAGGTGFGATQVDTVLLVRYVHPADSALAPTTKPDTVRQIRPRLTALTTPVIIDNADPFPTRAGRKLHAYRYAILLPERRRGVTRIIRRYAISGVQLVGGLEGDGCCTCYQNTAKSFLLDGRQRIDATDPNGTDQPVYITLSK